MTAVARLLMEAGATDIVQAASAGNITATLTQDTPEPDRIAALRMASEHGRVGVMDQLVAASTPVDGTDRDGSSALHEAAFCGRADSVIHLLVHGANPNHHDTGFSALPWNWCRHQHEEVGPGHGHHEVEQILRPITPGQP